MKQTLVRILNKVWFWIMTDTSATSDWVERGANRVDKKRYQNALELYERVIAAEPDNAIAWRKKAGVQMDLEHPYDALTTIERALELAPNAASSLNEKAIALAGLDRVAEALPYFQRAIEIDPTCYAAYLNLGSHVLELGQFEEALS